MYGSFSFSISPSNDYSVLVSFRTDWFDLLAIQETQEFAPHYNLKASILHLAFVIVQYSHPYMTIGKIIARAIQTFIGKVMSFILIHFLGLL